MKVVSESSYGPFKDSSKRLPCEIAQEEKMGSGGPLKNTQTPYFWLRVHSTPPGPVGQGSKEPARGGVLGVSSATSFFLNSP